MANAVELRGITKRFPGVVANDGVHFQAAEGEVHALLGENGAGKSTLSNILTGLYRPDEGEILLKDVPVAFHSPRDALDAGICMVHQHFRLVPPFTVAENVILGDHRGEGRKLTVHPRRIERRVAELGERYRIAVDPRARIWQLSLGEQQRVEILKALYREARILILDEPTAVLTPQEAGSLFETLRVMADEGRTIIFISHKLHEVKAVSDRVTVLRAGKTVETVETAGATPRSLAALMVGREVNLAERIPRDGSIGEPVLETRDGSDGLPPMDLALTFDVVHDAARPQALASAIRRALRPSGRWLAFEIRTQEDPDKNDDPLTLLRWGFSLLYCMSVSLAQGGEGLGTFGLTESRMRKLCADAGFSSVRVEPLSFYTLYEAAP